MNKYFRILLLVIVLFTGTLTAHAGAFIYDAAGSVIAPYNPNGPTVFGHLYTNDTHVSGGGAAVSANVPAACQSLATGAGYSNPPSQTLYCIDQIPEYAWGYSCEGGVCTGGYSGYFPMYRVIDVYTPNKPVQTATETVVCDAYDDRPLGSTYDPYPNSSCYLYSQAPAASPPTAALSANPTSITTGNSSALTWSSTNATSCTGTNFNTGGATSGTVSVSPGATTTYSVTCTGAGGTSAPASATVTVTAAPAPTAALSASPTTIVQGNSSTLTWSSTNATSCSGTNFNTAGATSGSVSVSPGSTTTYSVTCTGAGGTSAPASATVTVNPQAPIASLSPGSASITNGASQVLTYACTGGSNSASMNQGVGALSPLSSTRTVTPPNNTTTTYTLTCTNSIGQTATASSNITTSAAPQPNLTAGASSFSPTTPTVGVSATISATITNAGNADTGASFTDKFQRATDAAGTGATDIGTYSSASIAASGNNTASISYAFPSTGTWYVRACADSGSVITESNEGDNCGSWTAVTVAAAIPGSPTGLSYSCNAAGDRVTLSWNATSGATFYYFRIGTTAAICTAAGAGFQYNGSTCYPNPDSVTGTTVSNFPVTPGTAYSWWVHAANGSGYSAQTNAGFTCPIPGSPDVTAATIGQSSATVNVPISLTSTVTNSGNATAGGTFSNIFQIQSPASNIAASNITALAASGSSGISASYTFTSTGSYQVRACADLNTSGVGSVTESNEANNCSAWQTVTVGAAAQPNLTAGAVSATPTNPVSGVSATLSAQVSNGGGASTGTSFTDSFWRATDASGTGATYIGAYTNSALAAGGNTNATLSYTFPSAATWYVRTCADNNSGFVGTISESNEGDNCGPWTAVTVVSTLTATCSVSPTSALTGANVTWTATRSGGTGTYTYSWSGTDSLSGTSQSVIKSYSTAGSKSGSVVVTSGSQSVTLPNCGSVTITAAQPNLTVGAVTPTSGTTGISQTYSATVTNNGNTTTSVGFTDKFQSAIDAAGNGATDLTPTYSSGAIAAPGSNTATISYAFSSARTWYMRACADSTSAITESNEGDNCGAWTAITVSDPALPDLTVTANVAPTTGTVGSAMTFTGTARNVGSGAASNFTNYFEISSVTNVWSVNPMALAAGASGPVTATSQWTPPSSGTYQVRLCVDGAGAVAESNEGNNCGPWTPVVVSPAAPPSITSCTPSPAAGDTTSSITWTVAVTGFSPSPTSYTWNVSGGSPASQSGASNTFTSQFAAAGNYSPTVSATNGSQSAGPFSCTPVTIAASNCSGPTTPTITASQTTVTSGGSVTLNWSAVGVANGTTCTVTGRDVGGSGVDSRNSSAADSTCTVVGGGSNSVTVTNITGQRTYAISCNGVTKEVIINVLPNYVEF